MSPRPTDAGGEYSTGPGGRPPRDPNGRDLPRNARELAEDARRAGLRERAGLPPEDD